MVFAKYNGAERVSCLIGWMDAMVLIHVDRYLKVL